MKLSDLKVEEEGIIVKVKGRGTFRKRIIEMGFVRGKKVKVVRNAPLNDPVEYRIMDYEVSLRRSEASLIEVITEKEAREEHLTPYNGVFTEEHLRNSAREKGKNIQVALVGNPNSGKTTLFNYASSSRERVGNYGGVTVDSKTAVFRHRGYTFHITDLPGTYSLSAYSPEELFVRKHILQEMPDIVINVVDASNLERNLYLTTQLIDMDVRTIMALNMYDDMARRGARLDHEAMGKLLGIPIVPTVASRGRGIRNLFDKIIEVYSDEDPVVRHVHINYGQEVEASLEKIQNKIWENKNLTDKVSSRFYAIKLLENDRSVFITLTPFPNYQEIRKTAVDEMERLKKIFREDSETVIADARYGFIAGALRETLHQPLLSHNRITEGIDRILTHRILGFPFFLLFMFITFFSTFRLGKYPMLWIDNLVSLIGNFIDRHMAAGPLHDMLIDGIIGGVGSVIVFLPNILILFFFISLMEDTGYMARAAFIMDKIMHRIGLHGKSFIPLIMGFGCNVPAIMATRTIEDPKNRLLTILINPFMSCSARLPVYILLIGAFFPQFPGLMLFAIYLTGIILAAGTAVLFNKTIFRSQEAPFVMELPPYRVPTIRSLLKHMWHKGEQYLKKIGGVILVASILIWALGYYPRPPQPAETSSIVAIRTAETMPEETKTGETEKTPGSAEKTAEPYIVRIGRLIEPALRPLGFNWKMGVSLLTGIAAKEVVVSTLGVLHQTETQEGSDYETLISKLKEEKYESGSQKGEKVYNPLSALSFLLFILIYFPCVAVVATVKKETGKWQWALFMVVYTTTLAWLVSFAVYQIGSLIF